MFGGEEFNCIAAQRDAGSQDLALRRRGALFSVLGGVSVSRGSVEFASVRALPARHGVLVR
jgi:hypothetical protein